MKKPYLLIPFLGLGLVFSYVWDTQGGRDDGWWRAAASLSAYWGVSAGVAWLNANRYAERSWIWIRTRICALFGVHPPPYQS